jgi:hypothetical protein
VTIELETVDLAKANAGSYYTIIGAGGDLDDWVKGYEEILTQDDIGKPRQWFVATGAQVNDYIDRMSWRDAFKADVTFLMFPNDGLDVGKLAMFRLRMDDKWFDDIVRNARHD